MHIAADDYETILAVFGAQNIIYAENIWLNNGWRIVYPRETGQNCDDEARESLARFAFINGIPELFNRYIRDDDPSYDVIGHYMIKYGNLISYPNDIIKEYILLLMLHYALPSTEQFGADSYLRKMIICHLGPEECKKLRQVWRNGANFCRELLSCPIFARDIIQWAPSRESCEALIGKIVYSDIVSEKALQIQWGRGFAEYYISNPGIVGDSGRYTFITLAIKAKGCFPDILKDKAPKWRRKTINPPNAYHMLLRYCFVHETSMPDEYNHGFNEILKCLYTRYGISPKRILEADSGDGSKDKKLAAAILEWMKTHTPYEYDQSI